MARILVTGGQGFVGSRLVPALRAAGHEVDDEPLEITRFEPVAAKVAQKAWEFVVHLAGISHVPTAESDPTQAYAVNLGGTAHLIEALMRAGSKARVVFPSTALVYASENFVNARAVVETDAIVPQNTYARTKWLAEGLLRDAAERLGLRVVVLRLFNHTHKSQPPQFFLPHVHSTLAKAPRGEKTSIPVGNLGVRRDIGSVADLVEAFCAVVAKDAGLPRFDIFNVSTGQAFKLQDLADRMAERLGVRAEWVTDPAKLRANDAACVCGSPEKLRKATGWAPRVRSAEDLIASFLE